MPDVVLTGVESIPNPDLNELEKKPSDLWKEFEDRHKGASFYAEIETLSK